MATVRTIAGAASGTTADQWSISKGFKDYLMCCFAKNTSGFAAPTVETHSNSLTAAADGDVIAENKSDDVDVEGERLTPSCKDEAGVDRWSRDRSITSGSECGRSDVMGPEVRDSVSSSGSSSKAGEMMSNQGGSSWSITGSRQQHLRTDSDVMVAMEQSSLTTTVARYNEAMNALIDATNYCFPVEDSPRTLQNTDPSIQLQPPSATGSSNSSPRQSIIHQPSEHKAAYANTLPPMQQPPSCGAVTSNTLPPPVDRSRLITQCGTVHMWFVYEQRVSKHNKETGRLSMSIAEAVDLPNEERGGANYVQMHLVLLPTKKIRLKTRLRPGGNTKFDEKFQLSLPPDELSASGVRVRLYACERLRRHRLLGESLLWFSAIGFHSLEGTTSQSIDKWVILQPRYNITRGDSAEDVASLGGATSVAGSAGSLSAGSSDAGGGGENGSSQPGGLPELMIGLSYSTLTGRLTVEIIKGSGFRSVGTTRPPDSQVKLAVKDPEGKTIGESKSSVRQGQPNPVFKEAFVFQVPLQQLPDVSLLFSVFTIRSLKRKEMLGWFTIGKSNSSDEETFHWASMRDSNGAQICRWHSLLEP